jgi:hypothetical protein
MSPPTEVMSRLAVAPLTVALTSRTFGSFASNVAKTFQSRGFHTAQVFVIPRRWTPRTRIEMARVIKNQLAPMLTKLATERPDGVARVVVLPEFAGATPDSPVPPDVAAQAERSITRLLRTLRPGLVLSAGTIAYATDTVGPKGKRIGYNAGFVGASGPDGGGRRIFKTSPSGTDRWDYETFVVDDQPGQKHKFLLMDKSNGRGALVGHAICSEAYKFKDMFLKEGHPRCDVYVSPAYGSPLTKIRTPEKMPVICVADGLVQGGRFEGSGRWESVEIAGKAFRAWGGIAAKIAAFFWGPAGFDWINQKSKEEMASEDPVLVHEVKLDELNEKTVQKWVDSAAVEVLGTVDDAGPSFDDAGKAAADAADAGAKADSDSRRDRKGKDPADKDPGRSQGGAGRPDGRDPKDQDRSKDQHPEEHPGR